MTKKIIWSPLAENDFILLIDYLIENWSEEIALNFTTTLENLILNIADKPQLYPVFQRKLRIRKCVISKHNTLYYQEDKNQINILRIFDNRQHPQKLKF